MAAMKFILVDDHFLIREALRGVLRELDPGAAILDAACWREASRLLDECPDATLVLLDLGLPDHDGFAALRDTRKRHPGIPVAILSANCERDNVVRALDLGAVGFIPKSGQRKVMLSALALILSGGVYIPPEILPRGEPQTTATAPGRAEKGTPEDFGLTARQRNVLALMMRGESNKAICRILHLAEPTVRNHVTAILKSLEVTNRTQAVVLAGEFGWDLQVAEEPGRGSERDLEKCAPVLVKRSHRSQLPPQEAGPGRHRRGGPDQAGR
jgi:DNA-binding NarL/FixJ family response regulator